MKKRLLLLVAVFGVAVAATSFNLGGNRASATVPGTNQVMNVRPSGTLGSSPTSGDGVISANGKYVAFTSSSSNLVTGDTNARRDIFVRDLASNTTALADISTTGVQADGNVGSGVAISETGRYVAFNSNASNLIDGSSTPTTYLQAYVRDTVSNTTTLVSQNSLGVTADSDVYYIYGISADGRFVLFETSATNLGPSVTNTGHNLYQLDRSTGTFTIVNTATDGTLPTVLFTPAASMSCDGSLIAFVSGAHLITTDPYSTHVDIFLFDRRAGDHLSNITTSTNGAAVFPSVSCNGNYIGMGSEGTDLDTTITMPVGAICRAYVYSRIVNTFYLMDQSSSGTPGNSHSAFCSTNFVKIAVSDSGNAIFTSHSTNITTPATTGTGQMFIRDLTAGTTELLSRTSSGTQGNDKSVNPFISNDGKVASYLTYATNLTTPSWATGYSNVITSVTGY